MADDIVERLRVLYCAADEMTPCGTCLTCKAADESERLRAAVTAIDDLHSPRLAHDTCLACDHDWPCPTILILHPEEARRG